MSTRSVLRSLLLSTALVTKVLTGSLAVADSAVISFTADVATYSGTPALDPFNNGGGGLPSAPFALINGLGGFAGLASPDWARFSGQIYIPDFAGDGTYTISPTNGVGGVYLHSPLLNRIEAVSLRTEGPLTPASLSAGAGRADGAPTQNRDDIYLPDFTPNGVAIVTINGDDVSIDYELDFSSLPDENAAFLRNGVTPTQIGDILVAEGQKFGSIGVVGSGTSVKQSAVIGSGGEDDFPYGGFNLFDAVASGNLSNTILPTTRGVIDNEIAANNISEDGMQTGTASPVFFTDPFAGESGTTFFYDLTGGPDLDASIALVPIPEPGAAVLLLLGVAAAAARRGRGVRDAVV
ncbi:MAG: hypothetical protein AAGA92_01630 [Planctomycetota bacterium]